MIYCCKCRREVRAELTKGNIIYPHRPDLFDKYFYKCPKCGNYVGCHPNTTRALGVIPTPELRIARHKLHVFMDPLWRNKLISRIKLYKLISKELGYTFHVGHIRTVDECFIVYDIVERIKKDLEIGKIKTDAKFEKEIDQTF